MSGLDRRPHETSVVLDQLFLNYCQDNLENKLQLILEIEQNQKAEKRIPFSVPFDSIYFLYAPNHGFMEGQQIIFETTGTLPEPLVAGIIYYVRDNDDEFFKVSIYPTGPFIELASHGIGGCFASSANGLIRSSDRNIFVGSRFYEARTIFPVITRTVGEWLRPTVEFSSINFVLNNVDGKFNDILPGGKYHDGFINKGVNIKIGLRDVLSTYISIFNGYVSDSGGFKRDISKISFVARDRFESLNINFPKNRFTLNNFPRMDRDSLNKPIPIIYGDYINNVETEGNIPTTITNLLDPEIFNQKEIPVSIYNGSPALFEIENNYFDEGDKIRFNTTGNLPSPLNTSSDYYIRNLTGDTFRVSSTPSGSLINTSGGDGEHNAITQTLRNVLCVIADNPLKELKKDSVFLARSEAYYLMKEADITNIGSNNNSFEVIQNSGATKIEGENFLFSDGDKFLVKVHGKDLGAYSSNIVEQARNLITSYGNIFSSEFDTNWNTYRSKSTPAKSAIANIKSRIWIAEEKNLLEYALSLLEQVRIELFISKDLKLKLNANHPEDWPKQPPFRITNFDIEKDSCSVSIDDRNNFNRVGGFYDFNPNTGENSKKTRILKNQAAIDQAKKDISKAIEFPNLYIETDVKNQIIEILKLSSSYSEIIDLSLTTRALLYDIGDFVRMNVKIGSTIWNDVPMMIRQISYDPRLKLDIKLWSFQMVPFGNPNGWNPNYIGIVGGDTATIIEE